MNLRNTFFIVFLLFAFPLSGQDLKSLDTLKAAKLIDTLFIDRDINNWSLRIFTNYKEQRFRLIDDDQSLNFVPNNKSGIGIGVATKKLLLDLAFNIKGKDSDITQRFDMQGNVLISNSLVDFYLQSYQGFNVSANSGDSEYFRGDIRSFSAGIGYLYFFNNRQYSLSAVLTGLSKQKKTASSFGLGGFLISNRLETDSSIVAGSSIPSFNEQAEIQYLLSGGVGIRGGYSLQIVLPANLFIAATISPGIGLTYKKIEAESDDYKPSNPLMYYLQLFGAIGYNSNRIYVNMSFGNSKYFSDLDFGNQGNFSLSKGKLAFGYKLNFKKK